MAQDVGKRGIQVAIDIDLGDLNVRTVCALDQVLGGLATRLDNLFGIASQEDFADGLLVVWRRGVWEMPGRVVCLGQGEVLFGNDASRYAL